MVSLDEQIQKDKQKFKSNKPHRNQFKGGDKRNTNFKKDRRGGPHDKSRPIRKGDRDRDGPRRKFRDDRGPRPNRDNNRQQPSGQKGRFKKDQKKRSRISRPPRKQSQQAPVQTQQKQQKGRTLRVMGLHPDFTNADLYKLFSTQGALQKCLIEQDNFGRSLTTAVVKYHNVSSVQSAIANLNQHKVMNSILTVQPYKFNNRR